MVQMVKPEVSLASGIGALIGLSILFFLCGLLCYGLCCIVFKSEVKDSIKPETESWTAKFYYDPLPTVLSPPPEPIFQPSVYSFKILNGKQAPHQPHAVINPAVLQYPPGHVFEDTALSSSHFQHSQFVYPDDKQGSRRSSRISPSNVPLVQADINEKEYMGNGHGGGRCWYP